MSGERNKEDFDFYLVGIRKDSPAGKGLVQDAKKMKYRYIARLIADLIEDRYEKIEGQHDEPGIWFPDPRFLSIAQGHIPLQEDAPKNKEIVDEISESTGGALTKDQLLGMEQNLDDFLGV